MSLSHCPFSFFCLPHLSCHSLPCFLSIYLSPYFFKYVSVYSPFNLLLPLFYYTLCNLTGVFISPFYSYMPVFLYFFHSYYDLAFLVPTFRHWCTERNRKWRQGREGQGANIQQKKIEKVQQLRTTSTTVPLPQAGPCKSLTVKDYTSYIIEKHCEVEGLWTNTTPLGTPVELNAW